MEKEELHNILGAKKRMNGELYELFNGKTVYL